MPYTNCFIKLKIRVATIWIMNDKLFTRLPPHVFITCGVKGGKLATSYKWVGKDKKSDKTGEKLRRI